MAPGIPYRASQAVQCRCMTKTAYVLGSTDGWRILVSRATDNRHTGIALPVADMHGQTALDLSGQQLAALPEGIGALSTLEGHCQLIDHPF